MKMKIRSSILEKIIQNLAPPIRTLLLLIVILITCIILTAIILYISFTSFMQQSLVNKSSNDIDIVHSSYENMTGTAKSILLTFYYDFRAQQLISADNVDYTQIHKALLNISSYYQHHPYMSTYYFINRDTNYVFTNNGAYRLEKFPDRELLSILDENDLTIKFKPVYRSVQLRKTEAAENVFTYVYFDVYDAQIDPKIIVINLSEDYLLEQINNTIEDGSCIDLLDASGNRIFTTASDDSGIYRDISDPTQYLSDGDSGYSIENINGQKTIVSYQTYSDTTILKYVPYSQVTNFSFGFIRISFIISAILLAAVFLIVVFSSLKLLRAFASMHTRYTHAQNSNRSRQEQTILKEILLNASPVTLKKLRLEYDDMFGTDQNSRFCVAVCKIDHLKEFNETFTSTHQNSFLYSITNVAEETFTPNARAHGVILDSSTVAIIFSHLTEDFHYGSLEEGFQSIIHMFRQQFQYSFSVAASEITADINQAYQSACTLIPYRFLLGHQSVIFYSKVASNETVDWHYPSEIEHDISRYISTQQWEKTLEKIDLFVAAVKTASHEDARSAINRLIYSIQITMDSIKMGGVYYPSDIQGIHAQLYEAEVLDEIRSALREMFCLIGGHNNNSETAPQKNKQLVKDVMLYIAEHYPEFNLSLNTIAQSFNTSPNVLGRIFKTLTGKPVFQHITKVRLKHAEDLLLQSNLTNKEIAQACGFENTTYFYSLFKQELGLTPSEYRKRHKA